MIQRRQLEWEIDHEIAAMLKENTGAHFLDSGGAYGRHWEKNQAVEDFDARPELDIDYCNNSEISVTLDVYHFLTSTLDVTKESKKLDRAFQKFADKKEYEEMDYSEIAEIFNEEYLEPRGLKMSQFENTYNSDCMLSQVLLYSYISNEETGSDYPDFIMLRIHNGCDVRGGYTRPKIFAFDGEFENFIMAQNDLDASCKCTSMYSDDQGYHWYVDNQPETTEIDKMLGIENRDKDFEEDKLAKYWQIQEEEKRIFCKCCKNDVVVHARIES
jgi:hypothetical protein